MAPIHQDTAMQADNPNMPIDLALRAAMDGTHNASIPLRVLRIAEVLLAHGHPDVAAALRQVSDMAIVASDPVTHAITAERRRLLRHDGDALAMDPSRCINGHLARAAACYALAASGGRKASVPTAWPWARSEFTPAADDIDGRLANATTATALLIAEMHRLHSEREQIPNVAGSAP